MDQSNRIQYLAVESDACPPIRAGMVSIIIVNWNGLEWLDRCIRSLLSQTYRNLEIILVDNASSDGSDEWVKIHFPGVKLVNSERNLGFAGGVNKGIERSTGEYIMLLNNDAWVETKFIEQALGALSSQKLDVIGAIEVPYENAEAKKPFGWTIDVLGHPVKIELGERQEFYLSGCCLIFSKKLYVESGGLDPSFFMYFEEIDWFWRLHLRGKTIATIPSLRVHHAGHGSSGSTQQLSINRFLWRNQNCLAMLIKNYSAMNLCWVLPLYLLQNLGEALVFLLFGRFAIAKTYWKGLHHNILRSRELLRDRKRVQDRRQRSDADILHLMNKGPGKLLHLITWFRERQKRS